MNIYTAQDAGIIIAEKSISPLERVITALETNTVDQEATKAMLLLEAAPDLLAALQFMVITHDGVLDEDAADAYGLTEAMQIAREAINKATGND